MILHRGGARLVGHDRGTGLPVVFQHGLGSALEQVDETLEPLPGLRRLTLDSRAQGASSAGTERPFGLAMFADDVLAFAAAAGVRRFVAGGISMGAAVALRLAVRHPAQVSALILARPAWLFDPAPPNMRAHAAMGAALRSGSPEAARRAFLRSPAALELADEAPAALDALMHWLEAPDPMVAADLLTGIANDGPGVTRLEAAALRIPVLVIGHEGDYAHPFSIAQALAAAIPGASLVEVSPKEGDTKEQHLAELRDAVTGFLHRRLAAPRDDGSPSSAKRGRVAPEG